jgi:hypothetical protein
LRLPSGEFIRSWTRTARYQARIAIGIIRSGPDRATFPLIRDE